MLQIFISFHLDVGSLFLCLGGFFKTTLINNRGDLKTRKKTGTTSCQIEIHFSIKTVNFSLSILYFAPKFTVDL